MLEQWNERFSKAGYAYGSEPNEFFKQEINKLAPGNILMIAEGEGRNGVYAAGLGWKVDAVDFSEAARVKALKLASERGVSISYEVSDLNFFSPAENHYDAVALIFVHLEPALREKVVRTVIASLRPGGTLILEAYDKEQLGRTSGGPKEIDLLYSLEEAVEDFADLDFLTLSREVVNLNEGELHQGEAVVVRFVGVKL